MSRDPLGIWGDPGQVGNGQSYCGNNPVNRVDPMGLIMIIDMDNDKLQKFLRRVAWFAGVRLEFVPFKHEGRDVLRVVIAEVFTRPFVEVPPESPEKQARHALLPDESHRLDELWPRISETLRRRLEEIIRDPDRTLEFFFFKEERAWGHAFAIQEEHASDDHYDVMEHPPQDKDNPIIKFAHELWRAMEQAKPGGAEAPEHEHEGEFFEDPVWTEGERPIRDELDMPRPDDPRQHKPAQEGE